MSSALTDADLTYFWLGPLGYLRQMPLLPVDGSSDASEELIGAVQLSMNGAATLDVFAHKRTWQLDWVCLTHAETAAVHAWFQGLTSDDVRIVDPRAGNRLTRDGASGGAYHRDTRAHTLTTGSGSVAFTTVTDYPAALIGMVNGGVEWSVPNITTSTLLIDDTDRIPLIADEQITASVWLKGSGNAQVGAQFYDTTGVPAGTTLASSKTLGAWAVYSVTFTPTSNQVAASLMVVAASGSPRTVTVGPALWHPSNTDWVPGMGCPAVVPIGRTITYPGLLHQDIGVTLREV
jgi:hypothetical protein